MLCRPAICTNGICHRHRAFRAGLFVLETTMRSLLIVTLLVFAAVGWLAFESLAP